MGLARTELQGICTYIPIQFAWYSLEFAFLSESVEWLEAGSVERPLKIHVLYMKAEDASPLHAFDREVEPSSERRFND